MFWILLALLAFFPSPLSAQAAVTLSAFAERGHASAAGQAGGAGAEIGVYRGAVGGRFGLRAPFGGVGQEAARRAWAGDLDLALSPLRLHRTLEGLLPGDAVPYVFAGLGAQLTEEQDAPLRLIPTRSVGLGVELPVVGRTVWLHAEGRRRSPVASDEPAVAAGWEARAGLTLALGRGGFPPVTVLAPGRPGISSAPASAAARSVLDLAAQHLGTRYVWGGTTPSTGFDCSGFVQHVFRQHGVALPRVTRDQATVGAALPLDPSAFRPGDLLFFAGNRRVIDHVAIYVGEGRLIHATESGGQVRYDDLSSSWYVRHLVGARRVL